MTFRQFAFNNVMRNKRLYAAYFLSSLFTVSIFFTFAIFAFHPAFFDGDMNSKALFGMGVAGGIIYLFSFFFVLYSMSSFLQSRKKEFGMLMIQGMSSGQIRLMVFLENMLIGLFATVLGIVIGLVFAKLTLLIAENVLVIDQSLNFYFPTLAILVTLVSFVVLFLFISFFVSFILRTNKLITLIKSDKQSKGEPKASWVWTTLSILLLLGGYSLAIFAKAQQVVFVFLPVVLMVIIGTYLLFTQLSVYLIRRMKRNKSFFWRKTNMILLSDLSHRMKDNARSFFMVAIILTVAFSAIGTLFGAQSYLTGGLKEANPYSYVLSGVDDEKEDKQNVQLVQDALEKHNVQTDKEIVNYWTIPYEGDIQTEIVKVSEYNQLAQLLGEKELDLKSDEAVVAEQGNAYINDNDRDEQLLTKPIQLKDGKSIKAKEIITADALQQFEPFYIVNDDVVKQLKNAEHIPPQYIWQVKKGDEEDVIDAGRTISEKFSYEVPFTAVDYFAYEINKSYGPILFIGLFIGLVFFVSAGSFLYFRLYSDIDADKQKFSMISKIGLTAQELKKVLNRQTAILFFTPMVVALVHGAVALTALSHLMDYNLLFISTYVLGSFFVIQLIYFLFVRYFYTKQIKSVL